MQEFRHMDPTQRKGMIEQLQRELQQRKDQLQGTNAKELEQATQSMKFAEWRLADFTTHDRELNRKAALHGMQDILVRMKGVLARHMEREDDAGSVPAPELVQQTKKAAESVKELTRAIRVLRVMVDAESLLRDPHPQGATVADYKLRMDELAWELTSARGVLAQQWSVMDSLPRASVRRYIEEGTVVVYKLREKWQQLTHVAQLRDLENELRDIEAMQKYYSESKEFFNPPFLAEKRKTMMARQGYLTAHVSRLRALVPRALVHEGTSTQTGVVTTASAFYETTSEHSQQFASFLFGE